METKHMFSNGIAAAAILAAGIASFSFGLVVCLSENIKAVEKFLTFSRPVGALSGKTDVALAVWLVSWFILTVMWKRRQVSFRKVFAIAIVLTLLGLLGTFPPFFDMF